MNYYQLNTLTGYSFGQSVILPDLYASRAKELGYLGIASSDSNTYAFPALTDSATNNNLKPIYGYRIKLYSSRSLPFNAVLYVQNEKGYLNLCGLISKKIDVLGTDMLSLFHEGLALVIDADNDDYYQSVFLTAVAPDLLAYSKIFLDDFYLGIDIQNEEDKEDVKVLYDFCLNCSYKTIAFPKASYIYKNDAGKQFLFSKALNKEKITTDLPTGGPFFLLSLKALEQVYREEDINETESFSKKIDFSLFTKRGKFFSIDNADELLKEASNSGLKRRLNDKVTSLYQERLDYELSIIKEMHFSSYFLLVSDYVNFAKSSNIKVGPGRGSAGGSLVSYSLSITEVDPIRFNLSFERFLNPKRKTMPDIDIDFEDERRDEVISYLKKKYGEEHVSNIITFTKLKPRSALNLVGPALGFNEVRLKKLSGTISEKAKTFKEAVDDRYYGYRLKRLLEDPYYEDIASKASSLVGLPVNTSIHAPGVILSSEEIYKTCPISEGTKGVVEYEYPNMERMGFLKFDILSLSNLTFIKNIEERIVKNRKEIPDLWNNLNDEETFKTLNRLDLAFIFQLDSPSTSEGMKRTVKEVKPTSFDDLASILALYRPGTMNYISLFARRKNGQSPIVYKDPRLEPILKSTYGIMLYQEQVIETVKAIGGFDAGDADIFRRAISKKDLKKMETYKEQFLLGAKKQGIKDSVALDIYSDIEKFAGYGFNKSHAYCYSFITYQLLYYKTHFPEEFYSVAFNDSSLSDKEGKAIRVELAERRMNAANPNINESLATELVYQNEKVYLPFKSVSNTTPSVIEAIIQERKEKGKYLSFYDFCNRANSLVNQKNENTVLSLINAGAFDTLCINRSALRNHLDEFLGFARMGFDEKKLPDITKDDEDLGERLYLEKTALGIILSSKLSSIASRDNYKTLLVTDDSYEEMDHVIIACDEDRDYRLELNSNPNIAKNSFILVKADFTRKWLKPTEVIDLKGKHRNV